MKKKSMAFFAVITVVSALSFIAFRPSSTPKVEKAENATCCDKMMKDCPLKTKKVTTDDILVESLSRQFISIAPSAY